MHPRRVQPLAQAAVRAPDDPARRHECGRGPAGQGGEATGVEQAAAQGRADPAGVAQGVGQPDQPPLAPHEQPAPRLREPVGAAQPRQPGPDDDDVRVHART